MNVSVVITGVTADVGAGAGQMEDAFGRVFAGLAAARPDFQAVGRLCICLSLFHPAFGVSRAVRRAHTRDGVCYLEAWIDYAGWANGDWPGRVDAFAQAVVRAIGSAPRTRMTDAERDDLLAMAEAARVEVGADPPDQMVAVAPVHLNYDVETGALLSVGASSHAPGAAAAFGIRSVETSLADPPAFAASAVANGAGPFKLYRRGETGLAYHEAWLDGDKVVVHWGRCGERGETLDHPVAGPAEAGQVFKRLRAAARAEGYRPLAPSRHRTLIVECPIDGFGTPVDLDRRHALEDYLNDLTGWLGLGHCDGGSIGSGSMEACCLVVDYQLAAAILARELATSPFADFSRIYEMR